jgi:Xaa-Pro aminopeptidase
MRNPRILTAVREETERTFSTLAPQALQTLIEAMKPAYPIQHRIKAATEILNRAGYGDNMNKNNGIDGKSLFEMTADELEQVATRLRQAREVEANTALNSAPVVINNEPNP